MILNNGSGCLDKRECARQLKQLAEQIGVQCEIVIARGSRKLVSAARKAAQGDYHTVIAGGGDGTINAVASELIGTNKTLGILPMGTFNYLARGLGMPLDLEGAFRACFDGRISAISVGEVNGRIFLNNANIGLYPVLIALREQTYRRWGRSRLIAYWAALRALLRLRINMSLRISADGRSWKVRTPMVFVARNSYQLENFRLPGASAIDDDGFSVFILPETGKLGLLRLAWRAFARTLEPFSDYQQFSSKEVQIDSRRILRTVAFDGERVKMLAPLHFLVRQQALRVLLPRREGEIAA